MDDADHGAGVDEPDGAERSLPDGAMLDEFRIVRVIGAGGFGITYLGHDETLHRDVAIKEYFPFSLADRDAEGSVFPMSRAKRHLDEYDWGLSRFIDEARTLAKLDGHPNVVRVVRYIDRNGTAYIVMDYVNGQPLSARLSSKGVMEESELRAMLFPLMSGLEAVHSVGMLHRDLKPDNIILRNDGTPVLIDFGAARQAIGARSRSISTIVTPGYAPIEQYSARGNQGPWTDIYALGAVAYACLTGKKPDEATERVRDDALPRLADVVDGGCSPAFLDAIEWALEVDEGDRPQSIADWRRVFEQGATARTQTIRTVKTAKPPPTRSAAPAAKSSGVPVAAVAAGAFAVVVAAGAWFVLTQLDALGGSEGTDTVISTPAEADDDTVAEAPDTTPSPTPPASRADPADNADFATAEEIGTRDAYVIYLRLHPGGAHAAEARSRAGLGSP